MTRRVFSLSICSWTDCCGDNIGVCASVLGDTVAGGWCKGRDCSDGWEVDVAAWPRVCAVPTVAFSWDGDLSDGDLWAGSLDKSPIWGSGREDNIEYILVWVSGFGFDGRQLSELGLADGWFRLSCWELDVVSEGSGGDGICEGVAEADCPPGLPLKCS